MTHLVEPRIQEEQCGFHLEGAWEFSKSVYMCFVDLEKTYDHQGVLWWMLGENGIDGILIRAIQSLYCRSQSLVRIAGSKADLLSLFVTGSVLNFYGQNF